MATRKRIGALAGIAATVALGASLVACSGAPATVSHSAAPSASQSVSPTAVAERQVAAHGGTVSTYLPIGSATGYAAGDGHTANSTVKCYAGNLGVAVAQADFAAGSAVYGTSDGITWGCVDIG